MSSVKTIKTYTIEDEFIPKVKGRKVKQPGRQGFFKRMTGQLGRVGKSLLFPIAVLPIAALLLRVGTQIPEGTEFSDFFRSLLISGGNVLFNNLHIVFGIGIAFGLTKDNRGEAALAGFIGIALISLLMSSNQSIGGADLTNKIYRDLALPIAPQSLPGAEGFHVVFSTTNSDVYDSILANNVLTGIISGSLVAFIYNKFNGTELPTMLGFFSGRRLIPVLTVLSILVFGILYAIVFPWVGYGLYLFSVEMSKATGNRFANAAIMGAYSTLNRLLIPLGLHHIPNTLFWFTLPQIGRDGLPILDINNNPIAGDINAFINGKALYNTAGTFQTGFFPTMMFGLPALVAVFYVMADDKEQKKRVLAVFGSAAVVSFLTGITEPLEFAFMFVSPLLFGMHALLTGLFAFITGLFGIQLGFGFSAGLIDYMLSFSKSLEIIHANRDGFSAVLANPAWILLIGAVEAGTYFGLGCLFIKKFNLATPGRGTNRIQYDEQKDKSAVVTTTQQTPGFSDKAKNIVRGFGGWENITNFQNCATRLRYDVKDASKIDEALIKKGGAIGVIKISSTHVQAIIGPKVEILNNEIVANKGASIDSESATPVQQKEQQVEKNVVPKEVIVEKAVVENKSTKTKAVNKTKVSDKKVVVKKETTGKKVGKK